MVKTWGDYLNLVTEAGNAAGTTLENQAKYEETLNAKTKELSTTMTSFWHNILGAGEVGGVIDILNGLATALDAVSGSLGSLGTIGLGVGIYSIVKVFKAVKVASLEVVAANGLQLTSWQMLKVNIIATTKAIWANIKAMAAWMISNPLGWLMLAGVAIAGVAGLVDLFTTSVKEHEEELENLKSEYSEIKSELDGLNNELQTTQSRIAELESKDKLTFTEGEELENLRKQNNELQRSIDLAKLKEKEANKKKNAQFVTTMSADVDNAEMTVQTGQNSDGSVKQEVINETAYIERQYKLLQEYRDKLKQDGLTENEKKIYQSYIDDIEKYISEKNDEFAKRAEGIDYIQNPTTKDDEKVNEWLDYINDFQDKMAIAMGGDNAKENAFSRLVDNWKFDELLNPLQKLGKEGKVTLDDLKSRMSDPVFAEFVNKLVEIGVISDTTDGSLRYLANAFNGTATSARNYVTALKGNDLDNFIKNLGEEAKALGTTESELAKLTAAHVIFNNTGLSTEQQQQALQMLATKIATTSEELKYLLRLFNYVSGDFDSVGASTMTEQERKRRQGAAKRTLQYKYGINLSPIEIPEKEDIVPYTPSGGDKDSSEDNTPDYEDPIDAIINRINLRADELAQQEEEIQNLIEIAELEKDYEKQISLTNDLIASRKKRIEELNTANDSLHNAAQHIRNTYDYDEDSWFDSQGNATEAYYAELNKKGITDEERKLIKEIFENLSKYKKAYRDNSEEILGLNKGILNSEKDIDETRRSLLDDFLNDLQTKLDDSYDLRISRLNSESSILSTHFDLVNAIEEEQHNLNKELLEAETIGARMNEQERESLFTKEEHTRLSGKLNDIMLDISDLQNDYMRDLKKATSDTIEEVTNHYERQYELKMKEYEIVKAELSLAKAQQVLENTENEKSVRTWNGSNWIYEANLQDVLDAQEDVENAKYELARAQAEEAQQVALNAIDSRADALETEKNKLATAIDEIAEKMDGSGTKITDTLKTIAETDLPAFDEIIQSLGDSIKNALNISDDDIGSIRRSGGGVAITSDAIEQMKANSAAWHTADKDIQTKLSNANKAWGKALGLDYEDSTGRWKKPDGTYAYATGTKDARKGLGLFDEDGFGSEVILTNDGILTQFNGGEKVFSPEMADRLWEMAQQNYTFAPMITQPDIGKLIPIEDKINNAISNISNAFGDTYMIKDVNLTESEGGTLKGFINFLKTKI